MSFEKSLHIGHYTLFKLELWCKLAQKKFLWLHERHMLIHVQTVGFNAFLSVDTLLSFDFVSVVLKYVFCFCKIKRKKNPIISIGENYTLMFAHPLRFSANLTNVAFEYSKLQSWQSSIGAQMITSLPLKKA